MMQRRRIASGLALAALSFAEPAWAQSAPAERLNWFWSIFAGFVLASLAIAIFAWFFGITRMHWSLVFVLWIIVTLILRYGTTV